MHGTTHHTTPDADPSGTRPSPFEPGEHIAPLLAAPSVWLDPPEELGDEVVDAVTSQLP